MSDLDFRPELIFLDDVSTNSLEILTVINAKRMNAEIYIRNRYEMYTKNNYVCRSNEI